MTIAWIVVAFNFYLVTYMVKHIPGNFEINSLAMFSTDVPACLLVGWLALKLKPRITFAFCFGLQTLAGMSILLFVDQEDPGSILPFLIGCCRFGVVGAFVGLFIYHPKMFPTLFGATSLGISTIFARTIMISAPMVAEIDYPTPIIVFAALNIIAFSSSLFLIDHTEVSADTKNLK